MKDTTMHKLFHVLGILSLLTMLTMPAWVQACPSCADAPAATSGSGDEEGSGNPAAYNNSIYVMVGVPYLSFGVVGFLIYRGMKKNDAFRNTHDSRPEM